MVRGSESPINRTYLQEEYAVWVQIKCAESPINHLFVSSPTKAFDHLVENKSAPALMC